VTPSESVEWELIVGGGSRRARLEDRPHGAEGGLRAAPSTAESEARESEETVGDKVTGPALCTAGDNRKVARRPREGHADLWEGKSRGQTSRNGCGTKQGRGTRACASRRGAEKARGRNRRAAVGGPLHCREAVNGTRAWMPLKGAETHREARSGHRKVGRAGEEERTLQGHCSMVV